MLQGFRPLQLHLGDKEIFQAYSRLACCLLHFLCWEKSRIHPCEIKKDAVSKKIIFSWIGNKNVMSNISYLEIWTNSIYFSCDASGTTKRQNSVLLVQVAFVALHALLLCHLRRVCAVEELPLFAEKNNDKTNSSDQNIFVALKGMKNNWIRFSTETGDNTVKNNIVNNTEIS